MKQKRVNWMADGIIAGTHPDNWSIVLEIARNLITTVGTRDMDHILVNPLESFRKLAGKLEDQTFSTIIDISGWVGYGLAPLFPNAELVTDFSLSRVRDVSTPELKTAGYALTISRDEITRRAATLDLSNVLIIDDAGYTGKTDELVMSLWGIAPEKTTHALLIANIGTLPTTHSEQPGLGAVAYLEGLGSKVIYGDKLTTPDDDAWHIRDLFDHPNIERALLLALHPTSVDAYSVQVAQELFPQSLTKVNIINMIAEGSFIANPYHAGSENATFSSNPLLWTSAKLFKHIDREAVASNREEILAMLKQMQLLTSDTEGVFEIHSALRSEARLAITKNIGREAKPSMRER